jgi:hypothetical protein
MTDPAGERSTGEMLTGEMLLECLALASLAIGGFFQRAGPLSAPPLFSPDRSYGLVETFFNSLNHSADWRKQRDRVRVQV